MTMPPAGPAPGSPDSGARTVRTLGLVVIGLVVACGLLGSCFFALNLLLPVFMQQ